MANQEHLDILKQGLIYWNIWRKGHPEIQPDLSEEDLREVFFNGIDLTEAQLKDGLLFLHGTAGTMSAGDVDNFNAAFIIKTDFNEADPSKTKLYWCDLKGLGLNIPLNGSPDIAKEFSKSVSSSKGIELNWIDIKEVNLSNANLSRVNLSGKNLNEVNLSKANLCRANLRHAQIKAANLNGVDFTQAVLSGIDFSNVDLKGISFREADLTQTDLSGADLTGNDLTRADLREASVNNAIFVDAILEGARLSGINLSYTNFTGANLSGADFRNSNLFHANLSETDLSNASFFYTDLSGANLSGSEIIDVNLSGSNLTGTNLSHANLRRSDLSGAILLRANFSYANLANCNIHGTAVWNVQLEGAIQSDLVITSYEESTITVDNLELAQFIYLLLNNAKIREIIDTITSKVVLILGRFTDERKKVLDALRDELRKENYLPVLFDFQKPVSRDLTETVSILAHLARFIIVDLTDPSSAPHEVATIIPQTIVPVQPLLTLQPIIIEGKVIERHEYAMFEDLRRRYHWVLPTFRYQDTTELLASLKENIIAPAEEKAKELEKQ